MRLRVHATSMGTAGLPAPEVRAISAGPRWHAHDKVAATPPGVPSATTVAERFGAVMQPLKLLSDESRATLQKVLLSGDDADSSQSALKLHQPDSAYDMSAMKAIITGELMRRGPAQPRSDRLLRRALPCTFWVAPLCACLTNCLCTCCTPLNSCSTATRNLGGSCGVPYIAHRSTGGYSQRPFKARMDCSGGMRDAPGPRTRRDCRNPTRASC